MGKKKKTKEKAKAGREKRFNNNMTRINNPPVLWEFLLRTSGLYEIQMEAELYSILH